MSVKVLEPVAVAVPPNKTGGVFEEAAVGFDLTPQTPEAPNAATTDTTTELEPSGQKLTDEDLAVFDPSLAKMERWLDRYDMYGKAARLIGKTSVGAVIGRGYAKAGIVYGQTMGTIAGGFLSKTPEGKEPRMVKYEDIHLSRTQKMIVAGAYIGRAVWLYYQLRGGVDTGMPGASTGTTSEMVKHAASEYAAQKQAATTASPEQAVLMAKVVQGQHVHEALAASPVTPPIVIKPNDNWQAVMERMGWNQAKISAALKDPHLRQVLETHHDAYIDKQYGTFAVNTVHLSKAGEQALYTFGEHFSHMQPHAKPTLSIDFSHVPGYHSTQTPQGLEIINPDGKHNVVLTGHDITTGGDLTQSGQQKLATLGLHGLETHQAKTVEVEQFSGHITYYTGPGEQGLSIERHGDKVFVIFNPENGPVYHNGHSLVTKQLLIAGYGQNWDKAITLSFTGNQVEFDLKTPLGQDILRNHVTLFAGEKTADGFNNSAAIPAVGPGILNHAKVHEHISISGSEAPTVVLEKNKGAGAFLHNLRNWRSWLPGLEREVREIPGAIKDAVKQVYAHLPGDRGERGALTGAFGGMGLNTLNRIRRRITERIKGRMEYPRRGGALRGLAPAGLFGAIVGVAAVQPDVAAGAHRWWSNLKHRQAAETLTKTWHDPEGHRSLSGAMAGVGALAGVRVLRRAKAKFTGRRAKGGFVNSLMPAAIFGFWASAVSNDQYQHAFDATVHSYHHTVTAAAQTSIGHQVGVAVQGVEHAVHTSQELSILQTGSRNGVGAWAITRFAKRLADGRRLQGTSKPSKKRLLGEAVGAAVAGAAAEWALDVPPTVADHSVHHASGLADVTAQARHTVAALGAGVAREAKEAVQGQGHVHEVVRNAEYAATGRVAVGAVATVFEGFDRTDRKKGLRNGVGGVAVAAAAGAAATWFLPDDVTMPALPVVSHVHGETQHAHLAGLHSETAAFGVGLATAVTRRSTSRKAGRARKPLIRGWTRRSRRVATMGPRRPAVS